MKHLLNRLKKTHQVVDFPNTHTETPAQGIKRKTVTTTITHRDRQPHEQAKVEAMKAFIDIAANEDLDPLFTALFKTAEELGYKLQADPYTLLHRLNNVR